MKSIRMKEMISWLSSLLMTALLFTTNAAAQTKTGAPLFNDLGNHRHPISTKSPQAQRYFNQGLILAYGFNHGEAVRSFKEAIRLDPSCAMCYWGVAVALGPNINKPMDPADVPLAWDALQQAKRLSANASEKEKAYIKALEARYVPQPVTDRHTLDLAYASPYPERALPSAKRLGSIAPGAGHLVHMPSHVYLRVGRYHDATLVNEEYAARLDVAAAQRELNALKAIVEDPRTKQLDQPQLPGAKLIGLSQQVLAGELAGRRLQNTETNQHFAAAIQLEDALPYMEPPFWHHPVRQIYGAALLEAGRPVAAEKTYREDLKRHPANGWSLYGLLASLRAQGKTEEAKAVEKRFRDAWRLADITLTASRF